MTDWQPLSEIVREIMARTGWSAKKSERWLTKQLKAGKVRARASRIVDEVSGQQWGETILPKEFWDANSDWEPK